MNAPHAFVLKSRFDRVVDAEEPALLDVYDLSRAGLFYVVELLRAAHTGALTLYLWWLMAGVIAVIYAIARYGG